MPFRVCPNPFRSLDYAEQAQTQKRAHTDRRRQQHFQSLFVADSFGRIALMSA